MRFTLIIVLQLLVVYSSAQFVTTNVGPNGETLFNIGSNLVNKIKPDDVEGSPLLSDEWSRGSIKLRNNKQVQGILLQYNLEHQVLYFSKDSSGRFEFSERILEFSFHAVVNEKQEMFVFRSNYPINGKYNDFTFYRVMGEGSKFQFLNYCSKSIRENYGFDKVPKRNYVYREEWFLYDTQLKTFHPISNKKSILAALPQYREQIEQLSEKNKWNLKESAQIAELMKQLK